MEDKHEILKPEPQGTLRTGDGRFRKVSQSECRGRNSATYADACGIRIAIEGKSREEAQRIAVQWSKKNGLWYDYATLSLGIPFKSGNENDTYLSVDGTTVYKINNLLNSGGDLAAFLDGIECYNALFPETAYEFVGFAGLGNDRAYPIFKQKFVPKASFATETEIDNYMKSIGFRPTDNESEYTNSEYIVKDLRPRNVLKNDSGRICVIDANVERVSEPCREGNTL